MGDYKICSRCIMDTSVLGIRFDSSGVCNFCREYDSRAAKLPKTVKDSEAILRARIDRIKDIHTQNEFDCVVGLSGGLDSTYAAYVANQHGLRLLGVHVDNGWDSDAAKTNIAQISDRLDIPVVTIAPPWEEFKDLQLAFLASSVPNIELVTDHVIRAAVFREAAKRRLRCIINGGNIVTEGILPPSYGHINWDLRHIRAIHRRFGTRSIRNTPTMGVARTLYYLYIKKIRVFRILNEVVYNKQEAGDQIARELGWQNYHGKHGESIFTRFFQGYILPRKFSIDKRRAHLSTLIASGQITREQALKEMAKEPYPSEELLREDLKTIITKIGISEEEFNTIMETAPRRHSDFPSNAQFWRFARFFARLGLRPPV